MPWEARPLLAAAAAAALVVLLAQDDDRSLESIAASSVGLIDPESNELAAQVPVGSTPTSLAVGEGAVWVLNADNQTISRVDPRTREVRPFGTGATPTDLAAGAGTLWIANGRRLPGAQFLGPVLTSVSRVHPPTLAARESIPLPRTRGEPSKLHGGPHRR